MKNSCFLLILVLPLFIKGQSVSLQIGDKLPPYIIKGLLNFPKKEINLSKLHQQLIILDFWNIWCGSCIEALPKMDTLQRQFGDEILILPITSQPKYQVEKFWEHNHITRGLTFPISTGDTTLSRAFSKYALPCVVWIDQSRTILAITNHQYVNEINIRRLLAGKLFNFLPPTKKVPFKFSGGSDIPPELAPLDSTIQYSVISRRMKQYDGGVWHVDTGGCVKLCIINQPILSLYYYIYYQWKKEIWADKTIIEVAKPERLLYKKSWGDADRWGMENTYCFQAQFPGGYQTDELYKKIISDLNNYFNISVHVENRDGPMLVVSDR